MLTVANRDYTARPPLYLAENGCATQSPVWDFRSRIEAEIRNRGGWVNCHAHIDRAYTVSPENFSYYNCFRHEKWKLNAEIRKNSTADQIYDRMALAIERMLEQGVQVIGTFIDVDCDVKDKAIRAAQKIRDRYGRSITIKYLNQSSYGIMTPEARAWFEEGAQFVDIIGGLLKADQGREIECLDILMGTAKAQGKMLHVHVDELNIPEERETEMLARKTIEYGMQGKVVGIHGISINARALEERKHIYELVKQAGLMFISCPMSWLNERRSEVLTPTHNPITPVDELLGYDIPIGIGTDNIADIFMPFNDADLWADLRVLMEAARVYDTETLVTIATDSGKKILGLK